MGFGYLLIGYLITFVLHITFSGIGLGGLALLLGFGTMLLGLWELNRYHFAFSYAKWLQIPLLVCALYETAESLNEMLLWNLPFINATVSSLFDWAMFCLLMLFNVAMLNAIRMLASQVGLNSIATSALRNIIFVAFYAAVYMMGQLPIPLMENNSKYLILVSNLLNIVFVVCNLFLLLSCTKNICRKGDEDVAPKRSRFEWINRINDTYEKNRQSAIDSTREQAEDVLRRRKEAREKKNKKKKK